MTVGDLLTLGVLLLIVFLLGKMLRRVSTLTDVIRQNLDGDPLPTVPRTFSPPDIDPSEEARRVARLKSERRP